eukprot:1022068-Rhodomonas_salina.1
MHTVFRVQYHNVCAAQYHNVCVAQYHTVCVARYHTVCVARSRCVPKKLAVCVGAEHQGLRQRSCLLAHLCAARREIKCEKPPLKYTSYQECGCSCLTSQGRFTTVRNPMQDNHFCTGKAGACCAYLGYQRPITAEPDTTALWELRGRDYLELMLSAVLPPPMTVTCTESGVRRASSVGHV